MMSIDGGGGGGDKMGDGRERRAKRRPPLDQAQIEMGEQRSRRSTRKGRKRKYAKRKGWTKLRIDPASLAPI